MIFILVIMCFLQLAADAGSLIAMTEDEKKRLDEILSDIGDLTNEVDNKVDGLNAGVSLHVSMFVDVNCSRLSSSEKGC